MGFYLIFSLPYPVYLLEMHLRFVKKIQKEKEADNKFN